ncbi:MAG: NAD(P)-dependent oxidoreductase [Planctomycetota bacterium]|nr:NAD(P)-dependent oxidoreductase [Planctomycetota bacterium]
MAKKRTKVGFVGLGLMGTPMAECLLKAGYLLTVWNRTPGKMEPLAAAGAKKAVSPAAVAKGADFVVVMVADDGALDNVLFDEEGLSRGMKRSSLLINCSTTSPAMSWRAATALRSLKVHYLEAPVMWSVSAAQEGKLQVLVGGSRNDFARAKPILDALGTVHYVGEVGKGATMRIACSVMVAAMMQTFAEAFVLARKAGVPFETMMEILHAGPVESPLYRIAEQTIVNAGGRPNFYLKHMVKDLNLATDLARQLDVPLPLASQVRQMFTIVKNLGKGNDDFSSVLEVMAAWSGVALRG